MKDKAKLCETMLYDRRADLIVEDLPKKDRYWDKKKKNCIEIKFGNGSWQFNAKGPVFLVSWENLGLVKHAGCGNWRCIPDSDVFVRCFNLLLQECGDIS